MTHDSTLSSSPQARSAMESTGTFFSRASAHLTASTSLLTYLCLGLLLVGCQSKTKSAKTVTLEDPQVVNGQIVDDDTAAAKLKEMGQAVDAMDLSKPETAAAETPGQSPDPNAAPAMIDVAEAVAMAPPSPLPAEATTLTPLPKLSRTEINEICEHMILHLESTLGYSPASTAVADALPIPPEGIIGGRTVARMGEVGTHILRFGYRHFVSQPPQFWAQGVIVGADGNLVVNPDLAQVGPKVTEIIAALNQMRANLTVRDLESRLIQLSYVDATAALSMLKGMGVTTLGKPEEVPAKVEFANLPMVVNIADPKKEYTGLVGAATKTSGSKLSLTPGVAAEMTDNTIASPTNQILVLFHPAHPEQFSEVRRILDMLVDRPARQIFIDAMVLEISQEGLRDLGVEWELNEGPLDITGGSLEANKSTETLNVGTVISSPFNEVFDGNYDWNWALKVRALIRSGKAEILSRPSVMTLNNRQSTIRVGEDIPVATSLQGIYGGNVAFGFDYLPTGILLNIRPRINETGQEVSMLIDTIVSARVPGKDLELTSSSGDTVLASAPTVSTRRVQTYGRIANNTPLIIGGLVAKESTVTKDKVPFLGDLPLIGMAFRSEIRANLKREVIIVLTPHVLPSKEELRRSLPKDDDLFDNFGNELFRDSYRIRGEDVFDLTFLLENRRIASYRHKARQVAAENFRLGRREPFRSFVRDSVPGESILVTRMIYEVVKRLDVAAEIDASGIIYFESQQVGGYNVEFLRDLIEDMGGNGMKKFKDKALAITYRYDRDSLEAGRLGTEPIPEISLVDCPNRKAWGTLLWELNQPAEDGRQRHTILIQNEGDVLRLRRALALKRIATLNGGEDEMRLRNFSVGKVLLMPQLKKGQIHVMDADAARFFFHTEHYYAATLAEIEEQLKQLDERLHEPEISILLDSRSRRGAADEGTK